MRSRSPASDRPALGPRVFVSYSFSNAGATAFRDCLLDAGFAVEFIEATTLLGEQSLSTALIERIRAADYIVPLIDRAAAGSRYVQLEIETARSAGIPVIPVLTDDVEPAGILADIPCLTGGTPAGVRDAVVQRMSPLVFAASEPMHLTDASMQILMTTGAAPFVDADQLLLRSAREVLAAIEDTGHQDAIAQSVGMWRGLYDGLQELRDVALPYRAALEPLLARWREPDKGYARSWNALTALLVGRHLNRLAWMFGPEHNDSWGDIRDGMIRARREIELIDETDELWRDTLWAIGSREHPPEEWATDPFSPLGHWVRCRATVWNGTTQSILLPDTKPLGVSLRLREDPAHYLQDWEVMWYVLPQLVDRAPEALPPPGVFPLTRLVED